MKYTLLFFFLLLSSSSSFLLDSMKMLRNGDIIYPHRSMIKRGEITVDTLTKQQRLSLTWTNCNFPFYLYFIRDAYPGASLYNVEEFFLACHFNRTVDSGHIYKNLPDNVDLDPCFNYAKHTQHRYFTRDDTINYVIKHVKLLSNTLTNLEMCESSLMYSQKSLDYQDYIAFLKYNMEVSNVPFHDVLYDKFEYNDEVFYCTMRTTPCGLPEDFLKGRCLMLYIHDILGLEYV